MRHLTLFLIGFSCILSACKTTTRYRSGQTAYELKEYSKAATILQKEFAAEKNGQLKREKAYMIAEAFRKNNKPKEAAEWYKQAVDLGNEQAYLPLGKMQMQLDQHEEAIKSFTKFASIDAMSKNIAQREIKNCQNALEWKKTLTKTEVTNVAAINTTKSDYAPILYKGKLIFTSSRESATGNFTNEWTGEKQADLFEVEKTATGYGLPQNFSNVLNTTDYEGTCTFSKDGDEIYFTRCKGVDEDDKKVKDKRNEFCKIYFSRYANGVWAEAEVLPLFNDTVNVGHPALSRDGKTLLVSADAKDGFGGHDLYYFTKTDSGWGAAANAGQYINTAGDEMFPWLDERGQLYFASNGLPGMGGLDIFKAVRIKNTWKDPQNLRAPINSGADDFGYVIEKYKPANENDSILTSGYFSSSRIGGKGSDDIFHYVEKWRNEFLLRGKVIAKQYENPENPDSKVLDMQPIKAAKVELKNPITDAVLASTTTDAGGNFSFSLEKETDYKLTAGATGYLNKNEVASTKGMRNLDSTLITIYKELELEKIFTQREIVIPNIYYDYDKATLRPESKTVLDSILVFFNDNKDLTIEIGSHTDSRGSDAYNKKLSQARAQSVVDYLIEKQVDRDRLVAVGYGETKPVNGCTNGVKCTEEEFQKNRRTTFRITGSKQKIESVEPENILVDPSGEKK